MRSSLYNLLFVALWNENLSCVELKARKWDLLQWMVQDKLSPILYFICTLRSRKSLGSIAVTAKSRNSIGNFSAKFFAWANACEKNGRVFSVKIMIRRKQTKRWALYMLPRIGLLFSVKIIIGRKRQKSLSEVGHYLCSGVRGAWLQNDKNCSFASIKSFIYSLKLCCNVKAH